MGLETSRAILHSACDLRIPGVETPGHALAELSSRMDQYTACRIAGQETLKPLAFHLRRLDSYVVLCDHTEYHSYMNSLMINASEQQITTQGRFGLDSYNL